MRVGLTVEEVALRDAVREMLARECPPAAVRAAWTDASGVDGLWARLAGMGVFAVAVPERCGGLGLDESALVPVLEEVGYAAVPAPVGETAAVAAPLLAALGDPTGLLPDLLSGRARVAVATGDLVPYGARADAVLTLDGTTARLGKPEPAQLSTVDASRAATRPGQGQVLTDDPDIVREARDRAALHTAAQLVGLGRRMLDLTVGYVRDRHQFGRPVGAFQAVAHQLADATVGVEFAGPAVRAAGWAVATGAATRARDVSAAVVLAVDAARVAAGTALQCHGAMGYTVEYDLHLYAKRAWALAAGCDTDAHLANLAESLDLRSEP